MRFARPFALAFAVILWTEANAAPPTRLTTDGRLKRDPVFLDERGNDLLFVVLERPSQLRLMKLSVADRSMVALHPSETRSEFEPAVSADGRFVAFVQNRGNLSLALVIQDLKGDQSAEVPPGGGFSGMHSPTFAPDNSRILFSYPEDARQQIFSVDMQGKNRRKVIDSIGINNWPSASPDGQWIAFSSSRDNDYEIYVARNDGSSVRRLTTSPKQDLRPRFSPDGHRIAFTSNRDGNYEIYVMNADGSGLVRVTDHPEQDDYPVWHPDGSRLGVVSERSGQIDLYLVDVP
jgi:Tol biopolymer transport system component